MQNKKQLVFDQLRKLAIAKGQQVTSERIQIYCEILSCYEISDVLDVLNWFLINEKFFPDVSEIIQELEGGSVDERVENMVKQIMECVSLYGSMDVFRVKDQLGDVYKAVEDFGGWTMVCETPQSKMDWLRHNLRQTCKSIIKQNKKQRTNSLAQQTRLLTSETKCLPNN